ncbi:MAG: AMP-binding protein [Psychrobium sp.]
MTKLHQFNNLGEYLKENTSRFSDKVAFRCLGESLTYQELDQRSNILASWFQQQPQLSQGDRVAIQLPNSLAYPIIVYAAFKAGLVIVNTNPMYTPREMKHQFNDAGVKALLILDSLTEKLEDILEGSAIQHIVSINGHDQLSQLRDKTDAQLHSFRDLLANTANPNLQPLDPIAPQDIAILQYTGGTTGVSKGAALTHDNLLCNVKQLGEHFDGVLSEGQEAFVCPLPLYHIYAFTVNLLFVSGIGGCNVLITNPQNPDEFIDSMSNVKFSAFTGINTLFVGLSQYPPFKELDFSNLKLTMSGGTTLTIDAATKWGEMTGCTISEGYGLSETSPVVSFNKPGREEIGTVGLPLPSTTVEIRDGNNNRVADGEEGELVIKGPQVMRGYWQREDENAKVFTEDGFLKTGDVAVIQPSGAIKIVDRLKDMILVSGFNVYPNEIEGVLTQHSAIAEAAVIGQPDVKTGEKVCAYVTVTGDISEEEIISHCRDQLTAYKVPKQVNIVTALPKSSVGKILRKDLRN